MNTEITWEQAKADAQEMELQIARSIPPDSVASIEQKKTGTLFSCSREQHRWRGSTEVTLVPGSDAESVVKAIEKNYQGSGFDIATRRNVVDDYEVQLRSPGTSEGYIIAPDAPEVIRIASSSVCFTLPEGTYPGGDF